jgi:hypothetical protein
MPRGWMSSELFLRQASLSIGRDAARFNSYWQIDFSLSKGLGWKGGYCRWRESMN